MFDEIWLSLSLFLSFLIVTRPPKTIGLETITSKTNLLGSPSRAEKILNNLTISFIIIYSFIILDLYFKV